MCAQDITSYQNSKVKLAKKLQDRRQRDKHGLFIIDYSRDLQRALAAKYAVEFALVCDDLLDDDERAVLQRVPDDRIYYTDAGILARAGYRQNPSGIVAVMQTPAPAPLDASTVSQAQLILGLVGLRKPGNIGALLRTADASGVDLVLLIDNVLDRYNPNIIRSSTGACFAANIVELDTPAALDLLKANQFALISGVLGAAEGLFDVDFTRRSAIILGTEDDGLDEQWRAQCDHLVEIPMRGSITDSLNVSVAGAVFMYEALRQRSYT